MSARNRIGQGLLYLWALPNSLVGLLVLTVGRIGGAQANLNGGVLEVHGPGIQRLLAAIPVRFRVLAITLGHVVLGCDQDSLERTRTHERAHVEQCQRWGPLFIPAYLLASLFAWARGGDAYRDNAFERQARAAERQTSRGS